MPVVKLDPNQGISFNEEVEGGTSSSASPKHSTAANELGIPGPVICDVDFDLSGAVMKFGAGADTGDASGIENINKVPLEVGKFTFSPASEEMRTKVREAEAKGEWIEVMNLDDVYIGQDFFVISAAQGTENAVLSQADWNHADGEEGRASFKVRLLDSVHSMKHITTSEQTMQKAKKGVVQSKRRREGEKVMYDVQDTFSQSKDVKFKTNDGKSFQAGGGIVSPIRGGHKFTQDLRIRSFASVETEEDKLIKKLEHGSGVRRRIGKLMKKVDKEGQILETKQEFFREMKVALPKLHPSPYKLKAKRLQDAEMEQMIAQKKLLEELNRDLTREEFYDVLMKDESVPLVSVKELLAASTTMPAYGKLVEQDRELKKMLNKPSTSSIVGTIQSSTIIEDIVPMSRQASRSRQGLRVPEVDIMKDDMSSSGSSVSKSPGTSPSTSPLMWGGEGGFNMNGFVGSDGGGSPKSGRRERLSKSKRKNSEREKKEAERAKKASNLFGVEWEGEGMEKLVEQWKGLYMRDTVKKSLLNVDEQIMKDIIHEEQLEEKKALSGIVGAINEEIRVHNEQARLGLIQKNDAASKRKREEARMLKANVDDQRRRSETSHANPTSDPKEVSVNDAKNAGQSRTTLRLFGEVHKKMIQEHSIAVLVKYVKIWLKKTEIQRHERRMKEAAQREVWDRQGLLGYKSKGRGWDDDVKEKEVVVASTMVVVREEENEEEGGENEEKEENKENKENKEEGEGGGGELGVPEENDSTVAADAAIASANPPGPAVTHVEGIVVSESGAQLRIGPQMNSKPAVQLPRGTLVKILKTGRDEVYSGKRRVFVEAVVMAQQALEEIQMEPTEKDLKWGTEGSEEDSEEEEEEEEEGEEKKEPGPPPLPEDYDESSLIPCVVRGWASLREGGDVYDRSIITLKPSEASKTPMTDLTKLPKVGVKDCPLEMMCKVVGKGGCIIRDGPLLDSRFVKNVSEGTVLIVKNARCTGEGLNLANRRVYVETMPVRVEKGYAYLKPYNLEVMQPKTVGEIRGERAFTPATRNRVKDEDLLIYKGWCSLTSKFGYPILEPCEESLGTYGVGGRGRKKDEWLKAKMERMEVVERRKMEIEAKWQEKTEKQKEEIKKMVGGREEEEEEGVVSDE